MVNRARAGNAPIVKAIRRRVIGTLAIGVLAGVALAPTAAYAEPGDIVHFADSNLKACVAQVLSVPATSSITEGQLAELSVLACIAKGVVNIDPLRFATGLITLYLGNNQVDDVSALAGLTGLGNLDLGGNQIVDVSPLSSLTSLTKLDLSGNQIVDVSPLSGLSAITSFALDGQHVDIHPMVVGLPIGVPTVRDVIGSPAALQIVAGSGVLAGTTVTWNASGSDSLLYWDETVTIGTTWNEFSGLVQYHRVDVRRLAGADRFEASASISRDNFSAGVPVVYVANGLKFPDALSGAPVAGMQGGPVLLVTADSIPASIATELDRLNPDRIVVLGGVASVSNSVMMALAHYLD